MTHCIFIDLALLSKYIHRRLRSCLAKALKVSRKIVCTSCAMWVMQVLADRYKQIR